MECAVMKVSELTGAVLDYWVSRCEGNSPAFATMTAKVTPFSSEWEYGGPIIERDQIYLSPPHDAHYYGGPNHGWKRHDDWSATVSARTRTLPPNEMQITLRTGGGVGRGRGETPLLAAMRAKVASHYGDEVPDELSTSIGGAK
ncbi:phage protein NinX family protein [Robbsia sp. KACC 23696]|uniref:phage protein NinX family protein n=1 Tax=Robbsia sp. KACC 23696 TaxID=3149231 RepID=UPI00325AD975